MNGTPIAITGNLTDDPELKFTPGGAAVCRFSVAVNRRQYDKTTGTWVEAGTDFHRVQAWRGLAENIGDTLAKGMRAVVIGTLEQQQWTDKTTGEKKSAWLITATSAGPDLSFATATVQKVKRADGPPDDAWANGSSTAPNWTGAEA
jgi:single-strand DNA-binding protein